MLSLNYMAVSEPSEDFWCEEVERVVLNNLHNQDPSQQISDRKEDSVHIRANTNIWPTDVFRTLAR